MKDSDRQYCNAKLRVLLSANEDPTVDVKEFENAIIWDILALADAALWRISEASISAGNQNDWDVDSEAATKKQLEGRVAKVRTKLEEYEGEHRCKVQKWLKMSPEERQRFAAQHKPAGTGGNAGAGLPDGPMPSQPAATSSSQASPKTKHDDIPF